eukprot:3938127-Rhodomonas_salina.6
MEGLLSKWDFAVGGGVIEDWGKGSREGGTRQRLPVPRRGIPPQRSWPGVGVLERDGRALRG